jgi:hypothetical protein
MKSESLYPLTRRSSLWFLRAFALLVTCCFIPRCTLAQTSGGSISGTVVDPNGAVVNGAQVTIVNDGTNESQMLTTAAAGLFTLPNLNPGAYTVTVTAAGFAPAKTRTTVEISKTSVLKIALGVESAGATVTVEASTTSAVDLESTSVNQVVDGKTTRELPLNGRDYTQLSVLEPGVHTVDNQLSISAGDNSRANRGIGTQISIGGTRPQQNAYRLDSIITNDYSGAGPGGSLGGTLGVDAIQEFAVVTSNATAEYGRTSGGTISAVTRAGSNKFHGSGYEFARNSAFDAKNYFSSGVLAPLSRNQYGGAIGGPIVKDKLFFFFNYEGLRQVRTTSTQDTVPSPNARSGLLVCAGNGSDTSCKNSGGGTAASGQAGLKQYAIDPAALSYLQFFPVPNGTVSGDTGTWSFNSKADTTEDLYTGRMDYTIGTKDSLHGTVLYDNSTDSQPDSYNFILEGLEPKRHLYTVSEQHTFSPNIINFGRVGYYFNSIVAPASNVAIDPRAADTSFGFTPGATIGNLQIGNLTPFYGGVNAEGTYIYHYNSYQLGDDVYITKGKHSIQAGFSLEDVQSNNKGTSTAGFYNFGSYASFLANQPNTYTSSIPNGAVPIYMRQKVYGAYVADTYHLTPRLTFDLGLRYEPTSDLTEAKGHFSVLPTPSTPASGVLIGTPLFHNPSYKNFSPRVGLAWDPFGTGKTSIRAAYGIYDTLIMSYMFNLSTLNVAPFNTTLSLTTSILCTTANRAATGCTTLGQPLIYGTFPKETYNVAGAVASSKYAYIQQNPGRPYVQQYIVNVQQEVARNTTMELGYTGAHGVRQPLKSNDGNIVEPTNPGAWALQWPSATQVTTTTAGVTTVKAPTFSGTPINSGGGVGQVDTTYFNESTVYNSLIAALRHSTANWRLVVSYTFSKSLDESSSTSGGTNFANSIIAPFPREVYRFRGPSDFDVKNNLVVSGLYTVPGPKGSRLARVLGDGFQIGGIGRMASGLPFTPLTSGDEVGLKSASLFGFADRIYGGNCSGNPVNPKDKVNYIRRECFAYPQGITLSSVTTTSGNTTTTTRTYLPVLGNVSRNSLVGPPIRDIDASLAKNTPLPFHEGMRLELRAEVFNIFNHPMFQVPSRASTVLFNNTGAPTSSQQLSATSVPERQIQFGAKVIF